MSLKYIKELITANNNDLHSTLEINKSTIELIDKGGMINESGYQILLKLHQKIENKEFSWETLESNDYEEIKEITSFKNFTLKSTKNHYLYLFGNCSLMSDAFSLQLIKSFVLEPYYLFGTPIYDRTLRIQSDLLQIMFVFHLQRDFRFKHKIDGTNYEISEPLSRIKFREANRKDPEIQKKYFSNEFDLKQFVYGLYDTYFPNVTWRYIGTGHFAHRLALQITEFMFQVGLWDYKDLEKLVFILLEKTENLVRLEESCLKDSNNLSVTFNEELHTLITDIKEYLSLNLLHIVFLLNDYALLKEIDKEHHHSAGVNWEGSYLCTAKLQSILNHICMTYLVKQEALPKNSSLYKLTNLRVIESLDSFFTLISSNPKDIYANSLKISTNYDINFFRDPNVLQASEIREAKDITEELEYLIGDIMINGVFGNFETMTQNDNIERAVIFSILPLIEYLEEQDTEKLYYKQMSIIEHNGLELIMCIMNIIVNLDKNRAMLFLSKTILLICQNNPVIQYMMFQSQPAVLFEKFLQDKPLVGTFLLRLLIQNNPSILKSNDIIYLNARDTFKNLLRLFFTKEYNMDKLNDIVDDPGKSTVNIVALYSIIGLLEEILQVSIQDGAVSKGYDIEIQEIVLEHLKKHIFPYMMGTKEQLSRDPESNKIIYKEILRGNTANLFNKERNLGNGHSVAGEISLNSSIADLDAHEESAALSQPELRSILFDFNSSMVRLLNKSTERIYFSTDYESLFETKKKVDILAYLMDFEGGIPFATEMLIFWNNFIVFENNKLFGTRRAELLKNQGVIFMESTIPKDQTIISALIDAVIESLNKLQKFDVQEETDFAKNVEDFLYRGLFPIIYKYVNGVVSQYYVDKKLKNTEVLQTCLTNIAKLYSALEEGVVSLARLTSGRFSSDAFNDSMHEVNLNDPFLREEIDFSEILYPELFKLRRMSATILRTVYAVYPSNLRHYITVYYRPTPLRSLAPPNEEVNKKSPETGIHVQALGEAIKTYAEVKSQQQQGGENNSLLSGFYKRNVTHIYYSIDYYLGLISAELQKKKEDADFPLKAFYRNTFLLNAIKLLTELLDIAPQARKILHYCVKNTEEVIEVDSEIETLLPDSVRKVIETTRTAYRTSFSLIYLVFTNFRQFCQFKTFFDGTWNDAWRMHLIISEFFSKCCEGDSYYFKLFFGTFVPKVEMFELFNNKGWTLFFDYYVRNESFNNASLTWLIRSTRLEIGDKPELFKIYSHNFRAINAFTRGPCAPNQRVIYKYRGDILIGLITRLIDDVNSPFYDLKLSVIEYIEALVEGEGVVEMTAEAKSKSSDVYCCTNYFSSNLTHKMIYSLILSTLKRLIIHRMFENSATLKKKIFNEIYKIKEASLMGKNYHEYLSKKYVEMCTFSDSMFVTGDAEITEDICDRFNITQFSDYFSILKNDPVFLTHPCFTISEKLLKMLELFAVVNFPFKLFIEEKHERRREIFGENDLQKGEAPEDICLLHILCKGSQEKTGQVAFSKQTKEEKLQILLKERKEISTQIEALQKSLSEKDQQVEDAMQELLKSRISN